MHSCLCNEHQVVCNDKYENEHGGVKVYTFDVSNCHTYFAGDILVHNGLTLTIEMEVKFEKIRFGVESSDTIKSVKLLANPIVPLISP